MDNMTYVESRKAEVLEHLQAHYNDDNFIVRRYSNGGLMYPYSNMLVRSEKYNAFFTVRIRKGDGGFIYTDDYHSLYMQAEAERFFYDIADSISNKLVKVKFSASCMSDNLNGATTFAEYVNTGRCNVHVCIVTDELPEKDIMIGIADAIHAHNIRGFVRFIAVNDLSQCDNKSYDEIADNKFGLTVAAETILITVDYKSEKG